MGLLDGATVREVLGKYLRPEEVEDLVDPKELAALILWLEHVLELKVIDVAVSREFSFVEVDIDDCGWEEWRAIAKEVKGELVNEGLERLAGKVALVCPKGLKG